MKKSVWPRAAALFLVFALVCGVGYTAVVTGLAQLIFPAKANGSLWKENGKVVGSPLLGQPYEKDGELWGRIMNPDVTTFRDANGKRLLYAYPSNLSPASDEYGKLVKERIERLKAADPERKNNPVPVDLVTCSGSGLDPEISPAAAEYQVPRIAKARGISQTAVRKIIDENTKGRLFGIFGEETVNVPAVNRALDAVK